jgi:CheY-like chemotaxis protein
LWLFDVQMPEVNSRQGAKAIWQEDKTLPLIAQTGLALNGGPKEALEAGFSEVIYRSIQIKGLNRLLKRYLAL